MDEVYVEKVLSGKMRYNLESIKKFSFIREIGTMVRTVFAVIKKDEAVDGVSGEQEMAVTKR